MKTNTIWFHLHVESKKAKQINKIKQKQAGRNEDKIGGFQRRGG